MFDLNHKYNPDETAPPTLGLNYYDHHFGFGGTGERFFASGGLGNSTAMFGGSSGRWVYSSVQVDGSPPSAGWRWVEAVATRIKPVVLDLDGDGLELTAATASPGFDFFASGHIKTTGWFKGGDGLLVYDTNLNGIVDNGSEISFLHHSPGSATDLQALAVFDTNRNSKLDSGDSLFSRFRVWRDADFDGKSDTGELTTLSTAGVASINLIGSGAPYKVNGNDVYAVTSFTRTVGGTRAAYDVGFEAYSRGSKLTYQNATWALVENEALQRIAVAKPGVGALTIADLRTFTVNGLTVSGVQLGNGNDSVATTHVQAADRSYYVDGGAGSDVLDLSGSLYGSTIKGGIGDDHIIGAYGDDSIAPGSSVYGDTVEDYGGNDTYVIDPNSFVWIYDMGGTQDSAILTGYRSDELTINYFDYWQSVFVGTTDGLVGIHFEYMFTSASHGIEYLWLEDGVLTRDQLIQLAASGPGSRSALAGPADGQQDLAMIHIV